VLFQQEGGELLAQQTGHVLAFRKRHELVLVRLGEHPLERLPRAQQPPLAKRLPILAMQKWPTFHGGSSKMGLET
jgi:hypothetical protein